MQNVVITGFMGTGKTTIGRAVAHELGRPFVDMDAEIEARAGKSVPRIFAEDGEAAFRRLEAALCADLAAQGGRVIATGGGALVDPDNRAAMMASGPVICLTCAPDEILRRVRGSAGRPLLEVADPRAEIERLLAARRPVYVAIPWHVDTTGRPVEILVSQVVALAETITLPVRYPGGAYPIHVGAGLLAQAGSALRAVGVAEGTSVALVSNPTVAPLYEEPLTQALQQAGFCTFVCTIPDGERHKTLDTVAALYEQFLAEGLDRGSVVLSLGGGVTGDVAGFAAATLMRGVRFAQVPTTLLAMTDASVGAKTGVDLPQGKNLAGAFKQPEMVLIDPAVLATLDPAETRSGMAEVIKHGVIGAPDLFAELAAADPTSIDLANPLTPAQLARSLRVKVAIVERDPFEGGRRAVLNLGHTVGHGLERLSDFRLRHGEAVSVGMVAAAWIAVEMALAPPTLAERVTAALSAWGLPITCPPFEAGAIWRAMAYDKKKKGRRLRWVLPLEIGRVDVFDDVPQVTVISVLRRLGATR
ncbi:MAG TPA: 3-dehydroquinate synthase [Chloroflexi bacterium]|nr:3-dehydroquinate synthase [Chloroflexota bacterium]